MWAVGPRPRPTWDDMQMARPPLCLAVPGGEWDPLGLRTDGRLSGGIYSDLCVSIHQQPSAYALINMPMPVYDHVCFRLCLYCQGVGGGGYGPYNVHRFELGSAYPQPSTQPPRRTPLCLWWPPMTPRGSMLLRADSQDLTWSEQNTPRLSHIGYTDAILHSQSQQSHSHSRTTALCAMTPPLPPCPCCSLLCSASSLNRCPRPDAAACRCRPRAHSMPTTGRMDSVNNSKRPHGSSCE
jgi:hypothetical protein